jgi:hypothetical protein
LQIRETIWNKRLSIPITLDSYNTDQKAGSPVFAGALIIAEGIMERKGPILHRMPG